jgi:hypothetical protein
MEEPNPMRNHNTPLSLKLSSSATNQVEVVNERVLKTLTKKQSDVLLEMYRDGTLARLLDLGLIIEFDFVATTPDSLILEQPLKLILGKHELPINMVAEIGRKTIELWRELDKSGYGLIDATIENWVFDGPNPRFVDFGSFIKKSSSLQVLFNEIEFRREIWAPVRIALKSIPLGSMLLFPSRRDWDFNEMKLNMSGGFYESIAKLLPSYHLRSIFRSLVYSLSKYPFVDGNNTLENVYPKTLITLYKRFLPLLYFIQRIRLKNLLMKLSRSESKLGTKLKTYWSNYEKKNQAIETERFKQVIQIISELKPKSLTDIGGNSGYLSRELSEIIPQCRFSNLDIDMGAISVGIQASRETSKQITFGLFDISNPIEDKNLPSIELRFKADVVTCLALTHHILLQDFLPIERMWSRLSSLTDQYLLIEFMPLGLWSPGQKYSDTPTWYSEEYFCESFELFFDIERRLLLEENRILFVLRKKK